LSPHMGEEVEWYVDDDRSTIGIIARGNPSSAWSYAILKRNANGEFRVSTLSQEFKDLSAARGDCLQEMEAASDE